MFNSTLVQQGLKAHVDELQHLDRWRGRQFGLKAVEPERITARQIEAARRAITREMKRQGRVWIRVFPDVPVSSKPTEVRMGSGKGAPDYWAARVHPGRIMFEVDGVAENIAKEALRLGAAKLPIRTRVVQRIAD